jgi:hypothetical protein
MTNRNINVLKLLLSWGWTSKVFHSELKATRHTNIRANVNSKNFRKSPLPFRVWLPLPPWCEASKDFLIQLQKCATKLNYIPEICANQLNRWPCIRRIPNKYTASPT